MGADLESRQGHDGSSDVASVQSGWPAWENQWEIGRFGCHHLVVWRSPVLGGHPSRGANEHSWGNRQKTEIIVCCFLNTFMRSMSEIAMVIMTPITTKVKGNSTSALELQVMLMHQSFDDLGGIVACNQRVIDKDSNMSIVITSVVHWDVTFCLGGYKSYFTQCIR